MSELKAFVARKIDDGTCDPVPCIEVYSKSEADKVIAELELKLAAAQQVLRLNKPEALYSNLETMSRLRHEIDVVERRERHHKYKRCMAMANKCQEAICYWDNVKYTYFKGEAYCYKKLDHYGKWGQIWLAIAEKFKEAK